MPHIKNAVRRKWFQYLIPVLRLGEGAVKELCFLFFAGIAYFSDRCPRMTRNGPVRMGLISQEFFREDLGGYGGYGKTVQNLTRYYNGAGKKFGASIVIPRDLGIVTRPELRKIESSDMLLLPSLARLILHAFRYVRILKHMKLRFFLTLDYMLKYEYVLWAAPKVPLIIYIRDPRAKREWELISTVALEAQAHTRRNKRDLIAIASQQAASFRRVRRWSRRFRRPVIFVANAHFLVEREKRKLGLNRLSTYVLPNPVPLPKIEKIAYAERPLLLALGRLDPQKRPWIIFELARRLPKIDFVVAGQTHFPLLLKPFLEKYLHLPNLKMTGMVFGLQKEALLKRCWALINTSIHEGLPVSFLEAFSYGKCVISCQNPDGLVERFGYYMGPLLGEGLDNDTLNEFEHRIRDCISDEGERRKKGSLARQYIEKNHSFDNFNRRLEIILKTEGIL